jgi:hypothetical protein
MWKAVAYSTWDSWCNQNHSIGYWRTNEFARRRPMPCSRWIVGLATSWTSPVSMWVIQRREYPNPNFLFVRSNMRQLEITFTPHEIGRKYKISDAADWIFSMNYGSLDTTLSKPATPMLLTWDYTSEFCRSCGGGAISWLTTPSRVFSLVSTANDFWREREGGNFWSRWLSFSHICIHVLNILTNILFKCNTVTFGFLSGREWPQKKTNLWISSRDMNFLTVFMTSYFCDVILTTLLWRHIFVTSF